jgi:hypothetical protein
MKKRKSTSTTSDDDHYLDLSQIDDLDEADDGQQHCLVWCETHEAYEWHWLAFPLDGHRRIAA